MDLQPWDQQPNETDRAYSAFCMYRNTHTYKRSIRDLCVQMTHNLNNQALFFKWSRKNNWVERAAAWDAYHEDLDRQEWRERRQQVRENDYIQGNELRELADQLIEDAGNYVKERRVIEDGVVVIYRQIDMNICLRMIELASKLQRLATGEPTQSISLSSSALDQLIQRELRRLANGGEEPGVGGEADDWDEEDEELDGE